MFDAYEPLDVRAMMKAHLDLLVRAEEGVMNRLIALPLAALAALRAGRLRQATTGNCRAGSRANWCSSVPTSRAGSKMLKVREGDTVQKGKLLFTLDDDLQKADVAVKQAALINAQQAYNRAEELLKSASGTQQGARRRRRGVAPGQGQSGACADPADAPARA